MPESIYSPDYFTKCAVLVKNPVEAFRERVEKLEIPCIGKAIGYTELVKEYNRFEEKRKLCREFDLFFCDYRIYDLMRKPLGKVFYDRKKFPFPIDCENAPAYSGCTTFEEYLNSLTKQTSYFIQGNGPNYTLRVARVTMNVATIVKNVLGGVPNLIAHILQAGELEPSAVRRISLKTATSPSLPVASFVSEAEKGLLKQAAKLAQKAV